MDDFHSHTFPLNGHELLDRAERLERETDRDTLWRGIVRTLVDIGFPHVIYLMSDHDRKNVTLLTNIPQIYDGSDPARDPFLDYCCHSYEASRTGVCHLDLHSYLPPEARRFIAGAEAVGFRSGFGIPTRLDDSPRFGGFNLGTPLDPASFEQRFGPALPEIRAFCLLMHRRLEELGRLDATANDRLSPREREVLTLIANGATRKECARLTGLSPNTVAEYTKSAYRKLGVRNRAEALARLLG